MKRLPMLLLTAACALLPALAGPLVLVGDDEEELTCGTDSDCLLLCERDLQRPCTDEDIFGPADESDDEPDDEEVCHAVPGDCEREGK